MGATTGPLSQAQVRHARCRFQRVASEMLQNTQARYPELRMRRRLECWDLELVPRIRGIRAVAALRRISQLLPPRVGAAVLRTWWSGWCTARRFGGRASCLFCGADNGDSVEHAGVCPTLAAFGRDYLHLPYAGTLELRRRAFLLLDPRSQLSDITLAMGAVRMAAAYPEHCRFRRQRGVWGPAWARRALEQAAKQAVLGHTGAMRLFDSRWTADSRAPARCGSTQR